MLANNQWLENKIWCMLRKKRVFYAHKIIEDGFCVTQNAIKQMPEQLYLFRKKETIKNKKNRDES